jgi:hypothetical protein
MKFNFIIVLDIIAIYFKKKVTADLSILTVLKKVSCNILISIHFAKIKQERRVHKEVCEESFNDVIIDKLPQ